MLGSLGGGGFPKVGVPSLGALLLDWLEPLILRGPASFFQRSQRLQNPSIKEYTLNLIGVPMIL